MSSSHPEHYRDVDPLAESYERPAPWVGYVARAFEPGGDGLNDPSGIRARVEVTDQWTFPNKALTNLEAFELAARRIRGGDTYISTDPANIGSELAAYNRRLLKNRNSGEISPPDLYYAVVFTGVTPDHINQALDDLIAQSRT